MRPTTNFACSVSFLDSSLKYDRKVKPKSASDSEAKNGFRVPAKACSPAFYIYSIKVKPILASKIVPVFGTKNRSSFWLHFSVKFCGSLKSYPKKNSAGEIRCRSHQSFLCTGTWCISGLGCATFCSSCCRKLCLQTVMGDFDAQAHTHARPHISSRK